MKLAQLIHNEKTIPVCIDGDSFLALKDVSSMTDIIATLQVQKRVAAQIAAAQPSDWQPIADHRYALPIENPGQIICIGLNYRLHAKEGGHDEPSYPAIFLRTRQSFVPHGAALVKPLASDKFDYESELAVVIGKTCHHASRKEALDCIFGYTILNDGSLRDYQRKSAQWTAGKNFHKSGAFGPCIVTKDELPAGADGLRLTCKLNGETLQDASTSDLIFPVAQLIEILSEIMVLEPGDIIATGTPSGVGFARKPPVWMKAGDTCECSIERIGTLSNTVENEQPN